jgi:hypothetical protein
MGYDEAQFPEFDEIQQDLVTAVTSFNESLFSAFYYGLKQVYITPVAGQDGKPVYQWNTAVINAWHGDGKTREEAIAVGAA